MDYERTPPRKIIKLSSPDEELKPPVIETSPSAMINQKEMQSLVLQHKLAKEVNFRENYMRQLLELYFLKSGGNILDFETWRKKVKSPHCLHFLQQNSLEPENAIILDFKTLSASSRLLTPNNQNAVDVSTVTTLTPITHNNHTYVKIQSPVLNPNINTKQSQTPPSSSPVPLQQLPSLKHQTQSPKLSSSNQKIGTHLSTPQPQRIKTSDSTQSPSRTSTPKDELTLNTSHEVKVESPYSEESSNSNSCLSNQEQIVEKAKHEATVMQRVAELQKRGLWSEKRLPKLQEPARNKVHWDYLMEEMVWLSADFVQEKKWKKAAAKKCARMIQKYFQDKTLSVQRAEKAHEMHLKRISSFMAKIVRNFWSDVERIVEYKTQLKLEEKRKQAFDQHLNLIVTQTEKYSQLLVEGMNRTGVTDTSIAATDTASDTSGHRSGVFDDDFNVDDVESSEDDEESIARAEKMQEKDEQRAEVEALKKQSEMDPEDFFNDLPAGYLENRLMNDHLLLVNKKKAADSEDADNDQVSTAASSSSDPNFDESGQESDDVDETILEQEKLEKHDEYDVNEELEALKAENDISIDDLIAKYSSGGEITDQHQTKEIEKLGDLDETKDSDKSAEESNIDDDDFDDNDDVSNSDEEMDVDDNIDDDVGLETLLDSAENENRKKDLMDNVAAIAESIQPKGNTLSSQEVVTKVPFLLKHTLREYQHIGLDWLVTMYDKNFNGILADEMGLGKTIQTIALLAHLACDRSVWGPHLVIVPTSVMLNWEMEFKKWCPAFKILTYYGSIRERKQKRQGWTKQNSFHVCITSYKMVIQDYKSFRSKKWHYLILDEAQNIKNFKSQRWQLLLNFNSKQRLLLTGTPLQNNLMELWSLMHFLMPNVFQSHREFKEWFSIPVTGMIEGNAEVDENTIKRLHKVLRPFLLRRLKCEVEKQMPKKYEKVVVCRLSKRQRYLYDDFMSRAKTKETLATGNMLSVINILMQLRKVCNHPNLFEVRPIISPFQMIGILFYTASIVTKIFEYDWTKSVNLSCLNLRIIDNETTLSAYSSFRTHKLAPPSHNIEMIDSFEPTPPPCPKNHVKLKLQRAKPIQIRIHCNKGMEHIKSVPVGTSPTLSLSKKEPVTAPQQPLTPHSQSLNNSQRPPPPPYPYPYPQTALVPIQVPKNNNQQMQQPTSKSVTNQNTFGNRLVLTNFVLENKINNASSKGDKNDGSDDNDIKRSCDRVVTDLEIDLIQGPGSRPRQTRRIDCQKIQLFDRNKSNNLLDIIRNFYPMHIGTNVSQITVNNEPIRVQENLFLSRPITNTLIDQLMYSNFSKSSKGLRLIKTTTTTAVTSKNNKLSSSDKKLESITEELHYQTLRRLAVINQRRIEAAPMYGKDLVSYLRQNCSSPNQKNQWCNGRSYCSTVLTYNDTSNFLKEFVQTSEQFVDKLKDILDRFVFCVPAVVAPSISFHVSHPTSSRFWAEKSYTSCLRSELSKRSGFLHNIVSAMTTQFPDTRLIQYDCGKLQMMSSLLKELKSENHRVLIFTQMTRMLDILETFLNFHGYIYLRLDGSTRVEQRQVLMERFNTDPKIFAFILSTRSGGIGVNLTGADTVIFYDSDWNPTMDAQAQDRCHRIGQTRDVHIYRLISEKTVEENILRKANQKRLLGNIAIEGGNFTTAFFKTGSIHELFTIDDEQQQSVVTDTLVPSTSANNGNGDGTVCVESMTALESALACCEDELDVQAANVAKAEAVAELDEFDESIPFEEQQQDKEPEISKVDLELQNLMKQLTPIEKYMMTFIEAVDSEWAQKQLQIADKEIELQKQEWEENQKRQQREEQEQSKLVQDDDDQEILTISRDETANKMWCPPTPPQDNNDVYIDHNLAMLYETNTVMIESQLPAVYVRKETQKRKRSDSMNETYINAFPTISNRPVKCRKTDVTLTPKSIFDYNIYTSKIRRDFRLQKYRPLISNTTHTNFATSLSSVLHAIIVSILSTIKIVSMQKPIADAAIFNDWSITEDVWELKGINFNLGDVFSPTFDMKSGQIINWELISNFMTYHYKRFGRFSKYCKMRFENIIWPREENQFSAASNINSSEAQKKQKKKFFKQSNLNKSTACMKTADLYNLEKYKTSNETFLKRDNSLKGLLKKDSLAEQKPVETEEEEVSESFGDICSSLKINYDVASTMLQLTDYRNEREKREKEKRQMLMATAVLDPIQQQKMLVAKTKLLEQQRQQQIANIKQSLIQQQPHSPQPQLQLLSQQQPSAQQLQVQVQVQSQQQQVQQQQQQQILNVIQQQIATPQQQQQQISKMQRIIQSTPPTMVSVSNGQQNQRLLVSNQNVTNTPTKLITTAATSTTAQSLSSTDMPQLYRQQIKLRLANTASSNMVVPQQQPQQQQSQPQPQHSMHDYNVQINMTPKQQQQLQQQLQQQQVQLQPVQQQQQQHLQQPLVSVNTKNALVSQQTSSRVQKSTKQANQSRTITPNEIAAIIQRQQQQQQQQSSQQQKLTSVNAAQAVQILNQGQVIAQSSSPIQQIIATSSGHPVGALVKGNAIFSAVSVSPQMKAALSQAQPIKVSNSSAAQQQHQQLRQIQQTIPERKSQTQKMTQMPQVSNKSGVTQLIVQGGAKPMTIHQIIKQTNGTPVVLAKGSHGRMIPVPVSSSVLHGGIKQTVQLSTRSSQQPSATVVYTSANDIKLVQTSSNKNIITQLPQSFAAANQVRIQTSSGGPVVAVTVQPQHQQQQQQQQMKQLLKQQYQTKK